MSGNNGRGRNSARRGTNERGNRVANIRTNEKLAEEFATLFHNELVLQLRSLDKAKSTDQQRKKCGEKFYQVEATFDLPIAKLFQQASKFGSTLPFDLKTVLLLDSQSTVDLFCNRSYVNKVSRSASGMRLKSTGATMLVSQKAQSRVQGYPTPVWFDDQAITNILALKNVIKHFHVTYDSNDETFVVHRESANLPNMEFIMHESGLYYYDPSRNKSSSTVRRDVKPDGDNQDSSDFIFVETVSGNKGGFPKRAIKGAEN